MPRLNKDQRKQLYAAMLEAFPSWDDLSAMVTLQLDGNLETISAHVNPLTKVTLDLITWAEARGLLGEVVAGALDARPASQALATFASTMAATAPTPAPGGLAAPTASADKERYKRLVFKAIEFAGAAAFRESMAARERAVCRVERPVGVPWGTGFLVGPDLLITNYHVLEDVLEGRQPAATVAARFDYAANADGSKVNEGRLVGLDANAWRVHASPIRDLDFALVRLAERAGEDATPGDPGGTRGWLTPEAHEFVENEPVFLLQHPKAAPLKIAAGGVVSVTERRVHYLANTLSGSSGSPCFTSDWRLAALHRSSDDIANVGVPFAAVLKEIQAGLPGFRFA